MVMLELSNFLHFVGLAFGLGGATIAVIISSKAEKDEDVNRAMIKIMPSISKLIGFGLILLIISGVGILLYVEWPLDRQILLVKHVLVAWIVIVGIIIGKSMKKMKMSAPKGKEKPSAEFLKAKKKLRAFSRLNLILWYLVTILSVFV